MSYLQDLSSEAWPSAGVASDAIRGYLAEHAESAGTRGRDVSGGAGGVLEQVRHSPSDLRLTRSSGPVVSGTKHAQSRGGSLTSVGVTQHKLPPLQAPARQKPERQAGRLCPV